MPHTGEIDVDHVLPGLLRQFHRRTASADARVRADHVDTAKRCYPVVERSRQRSQIPDIGPWRHDALTECFDQPGGLGEIVGGRHWIAHRWHRRAEVHGYDVGAFPREVNGGATTLASACSRDEGDLAVESTCNGPPPWD